MNDPSSEHLQINILKMRKLGIPWARIARIHGISRNSMYKYRIRHGLAEPNERISDAVLEQLICNLCAEYPTWGSVTIRGALMSMGFHVAEMRVRRALCKCDLEGTKRRKRRRLKRCQYSVPRANYLWHLAGHHKLVMFHLVVHGCIDGYSHKIIFLECNSNNRAATVDNYFHAGVERSGIPSLLRGDYGCENGKVADSINQFYPAGNRFIHGPSTHNQRIERLWRDVREKVVDIYKDSFIYMEHMGVLSEQSILDLFCLHYVFMPRIQRALDLFTESWNNHCMRTMHGKTPNQAWFVNMLSQNVDHNLNLSSVDSNRSEDSFIRSIWESSVFSHVPENVLNEWFNVAFEVLENPLIEDNNFGINSYQRLRNILMVD